jgi:hypothetical protein
MCAPERHINHGTKHNESEYKSTHPQGRIQIHLINQQITFQISTETGTLDLINVAGKH